ncbi:MAG TPA: hypothetical protein VF053_00725 [Streptosporangiales bacterium]
MTTQTCAVCHRQHRGSNACPSCVGRVQSDLRAVPELVRELDVTRYRQDNLGADPGKSSETRLAWSEKAAEAHYVLANTLTTWARDLWETNGPAGALIPCGPDLASVSAFLLRYPSWIADHEAVAQLADEIAEAVKLARRAIDRPADTRVYLGRCDLGDPENEPCDRELYAYRSQEDVECPACGASWRVLERREWLLAQVEEQTATAETLAALLTRLGVETQVEDIRRAARDGRLTNVGIESHSRRRRYRVGAVLDALLPGRRADAA